MTKQIEVGMVVQVVDTGAIGTVVEATKGWFHVELDDGSTAKYRAKELEEHTSGPRSMATQLAKYRVRYVPCAAASGSKSAHNGDDVAELLAGTEPDTIVAAAEKLLGMEPGELAAKYANLNNGQRRMNAGNRIRAAVKRGDATVDDVAKVLAAV